MTLEPLFKVKIVLSSRFLTVQCILLKFLVYLTLCVTGSVIFLEVGPIESLQDSARSPTQSVDVSFFQSAFTLALLMKI